MTDDPLITSLRAAVEARPDGVPLRVHLAGVLLGAGRTDEAVQHAAVALATEPGNTAARDLLGRALGAASISPAPADPPSFDWHAAELEVGDLAPPMFVDGDDDARSHHRRTKSFRPESHSQTSAVWPT